MAIVAIVMVTVFFWAGSALALDPLVPCGRTDDPGTTDVNEETAPCQTCDIIILAKNVSDFILFYLVPALATLFFLYAGFRILLGGGIPSQVQKGQDLFRTTVYGLMIMFLAWLIVNTTLRTVAGVDNIAEDWWKLECREPEIPDNPKDTGETGGVLTISNTDYLVVSGNEAVITWETNKPATSQVNQGSALTTLDQEKRTTHAVTISGLDPNKEYRMTAISVDDTGFEARSSLIVFKTGDGEAGNKLEFVTDYVLPDAVKDKDYSLQLEIKGGTAPYNFSLDQGATLPEGLVMDSKGKITGKPKNLSTGLPFIVKVKDGTSPEQVATRRFELKIVATASTTMISAVTNTVPNFSGTTITWATDKPATSQVKFGTTSSLGSSTALNSTQTNLHSVTLTGLVSDTTYHYRVYSRVTGFEAESSDYTFKTAVGGTAPLAVSTGSLADAVAGQDYSQAMQATGGKVPYAWSKSGNFPSGLTLNQTTGQITGKPTGAGDYSFTITVQDSTAPNKLSSSKPYAMQVTVAGDALVISAVQSSGVTSTTATITWTTDKSADSQVEFTNVTTGTKQSSVLQTGTRTNHSVFLTGLAPNTEYSVQAVSVGATGFRAVSSPPIKFKTSIGSTAPLAITTTTLPDGTVGQNYTQTIQATGGVSPYLWTQLSGTFPAGVAMNSSGQITGRPTTSGTSTVTVKARDNSNPPQEKTQTLNLKVVNNTVAACMFSGLNLCEGKSRPGGCGGSVCSQYNASIAKYASGAATVALIKAFMVIESDCNIKAGTGSSYGLMQIQPATATRFKSRCSVTENITTSWLTDPKNADKSICIGVEYIKSIAAGTCGSQPRNIYAGYNGGDAGAAGACAVSRDCATEKSCDGGSVRRWECLYDDAEHKTCNGGSDINSGYNQTKQGGTYITYCVAHPGF